VRLLLIPNSVSTWSVYGSCPKITKIPIQVCLSTSVHDTMCIRMNSRMPGPALGFLAILGQVPYTPFVDLCHSLCKIRESGFYVILYLKSTKVDFMSSVKNGAGTAFTGRRPGLGRGP